MRSNILATGAFSYAAEARRLDVLPDTFILSITCTWSAAKDPTAERRLVQLTLPSSGLLALRDLIAAVLTRAAGEEF